MNLHEPAMAARESPRAWTRDLLARLNPQLGGDQPAALLELLGVLTESTDPESLLGHVALATARLCGVDRCSILLWRDDRLTPAASRAAAGPRTADSDSAFTALGPYRLDEVPAALRVVTTGAPVIGQDPAIDRLVPPEWLVLFGHRRTAIIPVLRGNRFLGTMHLDSANSGFTAGQLRPADVIVRHLALALDHAQAVAHARRRFHEKSQFLRAALAIGSTLDLRRVLRRVAREASRSVGADTSGIYWLDNDARVLQPLVGYRIPKHLLEPAQQQFGLDMFHRLAMLHGHDRPSIWSSDVPDDPRFDHDIFHTLGMRSLFATLLQTGSKVLGMLVCVWWTKPHRFDPEAISSLEGMAGLTAAALVNAGLYRQAATTAINGERVRLARELHDTLNATVFSTALKLDACIRDLPPDLPTLGVTLDEIKRNTGMIMANIRQLIFELGPQPGDRMALPERIRAVVAEAHNLSGIHIEYIELGNLAVLPGRQQEVVLRVVQEALANVVKHSRASKATVSIDVGAEEVRIAITDDGVGMAADPDPASASGHFGLRQIRERLDAEGGQLTVDNLSPSGSCVAGRFPIAGQA
jgi:signal transduction histidine kinase